MPTSQNNGGHHWIGVTPDPCGYFGFVYRIDVLETGQSYIGKRQYWSAKPKAVKCKSKVTDKQSSRWKPSCWIPADWQYYKGSSKLLAAFMKKNPQYTYTYTILCQCRSRGVLVYTETQLQWDFKVLEEKLPNGEFKFFNKAIGAIRFRPPEFCDDKTKAKISKALKGRPMDERLKKAIGDALRGRKFSEEHRANLSEAAQGNLSRTGMTNKPEHVEKVRKAHIGRKRSEEAKGNMRTAQRRDNNVYSVVHIDTEEVYSGTRYDIKEHCDMTTDGVNGLLRGRYKTSKGWTLTYEEAIYDGD